MKPKKMLEKLRKEGYKKVGYYRRNKSFIYLKKGKEITIPFSLTDEGFNERLNEIIKER